MDSAGGRRRTLVTLFDNIANKAWISESQSEENERLSSAFVLYWNTNPYKYTPETMLETIGLLSSPEGYEIFKSRKALPKDVDYEIATPEMIYGVALEFVRGVLQNIRDIVCTGKYKP